MNKLKIEDYVENKLVHSIHTSSRRAFRACRRRWNWVHRELYNPKTHAEPLEFGIAFHKAMETFYEPRTWLSPLDVRSSLALVAFKRECEKHLKEYRANNPDPDVEVIDSYRTRIELGLGMIKHYCYNVSPRYDQLWTPIEVEVPFEVVIRNPDNGEVLWCKCDQCWNKWVKHTKPIAYGVPNSDPKAVDTFDGDTWKRWNGLPVTYGGRLDMLAQDQYGRYWIVDWKTTSRLLDEDAEASFLQLDDQIMSYVWALNLVGIEVAGFVYVEIKKTYPQPPEPLKRMYKGRKFSTSKDSMTTHDLFLATVQKDDYEAWQMGLYDEYLTFLRTEGPRFTQRHQIHKNQHEIRNAGKMIYLEALDMTDDPRIYPMPGRFSCNWCLFKQPCLGKNMGEDYQYTLDTMFEKRTTHYYEEKPASTE